MRKNSWWKKKSRRATPGDRDLRDRQAFFFELRVMALGLLIGMANGVIFGTILWIALSL